MKILGVDPGSKYTGYAILELKGSILKHIKHGTLTSIGNSFEERFFDITNSFNRLLLQHKPSVGVIENVFLGKNISSVFKLGHVRGALIYEMMKNGMKVKEYAPRTIKKGITGKGSATKEEVRLISLNLLRLTSDESLDATDALANALYQGIVLSIERKIESRRIGEQVR